MEILVRSAAQRPLPIMSDQINIESKIYIYLYTENAHFLR